MPDKKPRAPRANGRNLGELLEESKRLNENARELVGQMRELASAMQEIKSIIADRRSRDSEGR